jgi:hypothetical protein
VKSKVKSQSQEIIVVGGSGSRWGRLWIGSLGARNEGLMDGWMGGRMELSNVITQHKSPMKRWIRRGLSLDLGLSLILSFSANIISREQISQLKGKRASPVL